MGVNLWIPRLYCFSRYWFIKTWLRGFATETNELILSSEHTLVNWHSEYGFKMSIMNESN